MHTISEQFLPLTNSPGFLLSNSNVLDLALDAARVRVMISCLGRRWGDAIFLDQGEGAWRALSKRLARGVP